MGSSQGNMLCICCKAHILQNVSGKHNLMPAGGLALWLEWNP